MATGRGPGWNPTRRNRNIGTENQGFRQQSTYRVPERWDDNKAYYENLQNHVTVDRRVHGLDLKFLVEPTGAGCLHHCTPDDVATLLRMLPGACVKGPEPLATIVMRQPTRKQLELEPVWGRIVYTSALEDLYGPVVFIDANEPWWSISFSRRMNLERQGELERARRLLGEPRLQRRSHVFDCGFRGIRRWLLYHTLIHEIGHWMDYRHRVLLPQREGGDYYALIDAYARRPVAEREAFAHRFSDEWRDELVHRRLIPFAHQFDGDAMAAEGLDPAWFKPPSDDESTAEPPVGAMFRERRQPMFAEPGGGGAGP